MRTRSLGVPACIGDWCVGLNAAFDVVHRRPLWRAKLVDFGLVLATFTAVASAFGLTLFTGFLGHFVYDLPGFLERVGAAAVRIVGIGLALAFLFSICWLLYRFVPVQHLRLGQLWPGALAAAIGLEALQYGFTAYLAHFANYNRVYGTLGGITAFLFLVYLAGVVILFGAEIADGYASRHGPSRPAGITATPSRRR